MDVKFLSKRYYKCPYCTKKYITKEAVYMHMEGFHRDQLGDLSPAQAHFNYRNNKTHGSCIICGKETPFNEKNERYDRLHEGKCKEEYREQFKKRMKKKYGKTTLLDDPDVQKEMLSKRRISGKYVWKKGKETTQYVGSYEKHFLQYLDRMGYQGKDITSPATIVIPYKFNGKGRFYIPDFYIQDLDLLVEIKGTNNHYQKREEAVERAKDIAAKNSEHNYIKIVNKNYSEFNRYIDQIKEKNASAGNTQI